MAQKNSRRDPPGARSPEPRARRAARSWDPAPHWPREIRAPVAHHGIRWDQRQTGIQKSSVNADEKMGVSLFVLFGVSRMLKANSKCKCVCIDYIYIYINSESEGVVVFLHVNLYSQNASQPLMFSFWGRLLHPKCNFRVFLANSSRRTQKTIRSSIPLEFCSTLGMVADNLLFFGQPPTKDEHNFSEKPKIHAVNSEE